MYKVTICDFGKMNINMTDNKNISVKKQLLVNKLLQDSQMGQKSFLTMLL